MDIQKMSIEEKLALLSDTDKAYILDYVERALQEARKQEKIVKKKDSKPQPKGDNQ